MMTHTLKSQFLQFLESELLLSRDAIALALHHHQADISLLPITLWKHEPVEIEHVSAMFDWLDSA
ncbi:MAG: DUF2949 domain-containing protein [Phormidesmis sp.]